MLFSQISIVYRYITHMYMIFIGTIYCRHVSHRHTFHRHAPYRRVLWKGLGNAKWVGRTIGRACHGVRRELGGTLGRELALCVYLCAYLSLSLSLSLCVCVCVCVVLLYLVDAKRQSLQAARG
jgi:hypothetical protein